MKRIFLIFLILSLILPVIGCSKNEDTLDKSNQVQNSSSSHEEKQSDTNKSLSSLYPVSDVEDGTGIEGTWISRGNEQGISVTVVLALNSNSTFDFFVEIISDDSSGTASSSGTYSYTDSTLNLDFEENTNNPNKPVIIDDSEYSYVLTDDTLTLTNQEGTIEYQRFTD